MLEQLAARLTQANRNFAAGADTQEARKNYLNIGHTSPGDLWIHHPTHGLQVSQHRGGVKPKLWNHESQFGRRFRESIAHGRIDHSRGEISLLGNHNVPEIALRHIQRQLEHRHPGYRVKEFAADVSREKREHHMTYGE